MTAYWAIFSARFRTLLQYRAAALAGFGTQLFWGLLRLMIFTAFYRSSAARQPMDLAEVTSYIWLGQALLVVLPFRADTEVMALVRTGGISYELVRPVDLYGLWFCRALALRTAPTLLRAVPLAALALACLGLQLPASWPAALGFAVSMLAAVLLSAAISVLMTVSLLWTISGEGLSHLVPTIAWILSGIVIPLPLFPDWAQPVLRLQPFRGIMDVPFRIYVGHIPPASAAAEIAGQLVWVLGLVVLGRWLLARGLRRVVVQGG